MLAAARVALKAEEPLTVAGLSARAGVSRATFYRLFGSRRALLEELEAEADPGSRQRVLAAAAELIGRDGLARLAMEELAARSGVSRATLYRLFPGKAALFRELVRTYSPLEPVVATLTRLGDGPPEEVMPELARAAARKVHPWLGVARTLFFEFTTTSPEALEGAQLVFSQGLGPVARYLSGQMAAGRLRPLHPLLALQAFVGPLFLHLITRELLERHLDLALPPLEEAVDELAQAWLRAMRSGGETATAVPSPNPRRS